MDANAPQSDRGHNAVIRLLLALLCFALPAYAKEATGNHHSHQTEIKDSQQSPPPLQGPQTQHPFKTVTFQRIIDGSSFVANGHPVILWGIHAPDKKDPNAYAAKLFLETMINKGTLSCKQATNNAAQKSLMRCLIDGQDVGSLMVQMGMATASHPYYDYEEQIAKQEGRGIWNNSLLTAH